MVEGLSILREVTRVTGLSTVTDVHTVEEAQLSGKVCEYLQIPHSLCRYTDVIQAAAYTGAKMIVKKGTFLAVDDVPHIVNKIRDTGNEEEIVLVDRGTVNGPHNLIVDMRNFVRMRLHTAFDGNVKTCIDATHSAQDRADAPRIAYAAVAAGADYVFMETHRSPGVAPCDGKCMVYLHMIEDYIRTILKIKEATDA
jgi:2-dehydro-3-deoxyphosphooctonate aldolase (KDO 8-P synthase)